MPDIISLGEGLVEFYADKNLAEATTFHRSWGGDTVNLLVAANRLGSSTGYITKLGGDPFASGLLEAWQGEGIDVSQVHVAPSGSTGIYFISLVEDAVLEMIYYRKGSAASTMTPADLNPDYLGQAVIFHTSGITQALSPSCQVTALAATRLAKERGLTVSYDPNFRAGLTTVLKAESAFKEILPNCDVVLASHPEETGQLLSAVEPDQAIEYLWAKGVPTVVVKLGQDGCMVGHDGQITRIDPFKIAYVVDSTGVGDTFDGAFLHCLARGATPVEAARVGVVMAALKCRGRGAVASIPGREDVERAFGQNIP